jgi:hypothetical protein
MRVDGASSSMRSKQPQAANLNCASEKPEIETEKLTKLNELLKQAADQPAERLGYSAAAKSNLPVCSPAMSFATLVGKPVPNFTAQSQIGEINIHDYISMSWAIVFTMPTNFNPVHSTVRHIFVC